MFWYDKALIQDDTICLKIIEPGLIYGATVFTTLRVYQQSLDHRLTQWKAHCYRLGSSLNAFGWTIPNWSELRQEAEILVSHYPVLRVTIFPDGKEWITGRFLPEELEQWQQQGVKGWVAYGSLFQRSLANHKTGNYLGAFLALQQAKKLGYHEAILVNEQDHWLETSTGNLWGYHQGEWYTPALEVGILPGIGRSQLLSWLNDRGIAVNQTPWTPTLVERFEIIAYSNSGVEIIPFSSITLDPQTLILNPFHPQLEQLRAYFRDYH